MQFGLRGASPLLVPAQERKPKSTAKFGDAARDVEDSGR